MTYYVFNDGVLVASVDSEADAIEIAEMYEDGYYCSD